MKTFERLLVALIVYAISVSVIAESQGYRRTQHPIVSLSPDVDTYVWINDILCMVYNNGNFAYDDAGFLGKIDGLYYPFHSLADNKTVVYSAGIWLGAKVDGGRRVAVAEYSSEFVPGTMVNGLPSPDNPGFRVYKIGGGTYTTGVPYEDSLDRANWPVGDGAPVDDFGNPLLLGDQLCWAVYNDADPSHHWNMWTDPLGVEIQQSTFGYSQEGPYREMIFTKYVIINKGGNTLDSMFVSLWCDPDVGDASDDLVGCDTLLSLGYAYNDGADSEYGSAAPAVGFDFLQSPLIESPGDTVYLPHDTLIDYRQLGMTSFNKYIYGTDPVNATEVYNYMCGLYEDGTALIDPITSQPTTYFHPGDPVTGTGWLDSQPWDKRYMMSSGPFTMEPGDTQVVMAAIIAARGSSALQSVTLLKELDIVAQAVYNADFILPVCGDVNASGEVDIDDIMYLIAYMFTGGPTPIPYEVGDVNCSGFIDIDDIMYLINYIFTGGPAPCDTD